jgi:hypothetical protein
MEDFVTVPDHELESHVNREPPAISEVTSGVRPQNLLLGPGPKTKSQGTGLKNIVTIVRNAG